MLRASSALTSSMTTATDTDAPTPTLLPAASASVVVSYSPLWDAEIDTSPLPVIVPPPVPTYALTVSWMTATATPTPTASLPVAPFSPCVKAACTESADVVNLPAEPLQVTPFVTSAFTVLIGTFTATDAPTPTFEPLPPPSEGSARAWFDMLVAAPM